MKKVSRKKLIEILCNKSNYTYDELSNITGYHPKSLVRIKSMIDSGRYMVDYDLKEKMYNSIINDYLKSNCKTYKEFYNSKAFKYDVCYSTLCKILKSIKYNYEMVIIRKVKVKGNYHFDIIDFESEAVLFTYKSVKNDVKSIKNILYLLISNYGSPANISFVNFFKTVPYDIQNILNKYNVNIICLRKNYRFSFENKHVSNIKYKQMPIIKELFYNSIIRKTIDDDMIQFNNIRYRIVTDSLIKHNTEIILYYDDDKNDLFVKYNDSNLALVPLKHVNSKLGTSKY